LTVDDLSAGSDVDDQAAAATWRAAA